MKRKELAVIPDATPDYKNMVDLLAVLTEATNQLADLKSTANQGLSDILDDLRADYAKLQETVTKTTSALELIARSHPEWFEPRRTIKTPYGEIALRNSTVLEIDNEEAAIVRIHLESFKRFPGETDAAIAARQKFAAQYIRTDEAINKEALETAEAAFLQILGIKRETKQNFTAKPATLDLGKAVEESTEPRA